MGAGTTGAAGETGVGEYAMENCIATGRSGRRQKPQEGDCQSGRWRDRKSGRSTVRKAKVKERQVKLAVGIKVSLEQGSKVEQEVGEREMNDRGLKCVSLFY